MRKDPHRRLCKRQLKGTDLVPTASGSAKKQAIQPSIHLGAASGTENLSLRSRREYEVMLLFSIPVSFITQSGELQLFEAESMASSVDLQH